MPERPEIIPLDSTPIDGSLALGASRTVLAVSTEWEPREGGVSTLNRHLCMALAHHHEVFCYVPPNDPSDLNERAFSQGGVRVVFPQSCRGLLEPNRGMLFRKPHLAGLGDRPPVPSIIIGHDYITGPYAIALREDFFPNAKVVIFVHTNAGELEYHKRVKGRDPGSEAARKHDAQRDVVRLADMVVAVGPRLQRQTTMMLSEFLERDGQRDSIVSSSIRLDPGMDPDAPRRVQGTPGDCEVLQIGRTEHLTQKGLDLAVKALGSLSTASKPITFVVRGCGAKESRKVEQALNKVAKNPTLRIRPKPFDPNPAAVRADLSRASLLVMPSPEEGFGLAGLDAIEVGVPILISSNSGLAELLKEALGDEDAGNFIVSTNSLADWTVRIQEVLSAPEVAFASADRLREVIAPRLTWLAAAQSLESEWDRCFPPP